MVKVMAGKHDLYAEEDTEQAAGIARADIHPQYDPWTVENDICLLTLDTALKITNAVDVVRPAFTGETFSGSGRVSGWGTLEDGGVSPDMLMSVVVELQEDSVCREVYGEEAVVDSMLCAGGQDKDACQVQSFLLEKYYGEDNYTHYDSLEDDIVNTDNSEINNNIENNDNIKGVFGIGTSLS